jgi:hypothetical protein
MLANAALAAKLIDGVAPRALSGRTLADANGRATVRSSMSDSSSAPEAQPVADAAPEAALVIPVEIDTSAIALAAAERAELAALRAENAGRQASERRALVVELVELGAETPATAWLDGAPVARLAAEDLGSLRERVAALRLRKPAAGHTPPPAGAGMGEEALEDFERRDAAKIKDPDARARFVASRLARKQKNHG